MRKDSEIFLRKCLQYKTEIGEDAFELNITYFGGIPNIEVEIDEIINELKTLKCISKKSEIIGETIQMLNWNPSFQFASLSSDLANRLHK